MLAGKVKLEKIKYPAYCTPKLDGIRCLMLQQQAMSRTFKLIRNAYVQKTMTTDATAGKLPNDLDGELVLQNTTMFNEVSSAIMRESGTPNFQYAVFDYVLDPKRTYLERMKDLEHLELPSYVQKILPVKIENETQFLLYEEWCLTHGYEGVMIRSGDGEYKFGRSTTKQGWLLKFKQFVDSEAIITGFVEKLHNNNPAKEDAFGHTKRSSCKTNLIPAGTLGKVAVKDIHTGIEFNIGSGFNDEIRQEVWNHKDIYMGKIIKYKYQPHGSKDKPRIPVFLGFRHPDDIS
jgi:DNA ligase-1